MKVVSRCPMDAAVVRPGVPTGMVRTRAQLQALLDAVIRTSYPELRDVPVHLAPYEPRPNSEGYFSTTPVLDPCEPGSVLRLSGRQAYAIAVDNRVIDGRTPMPMDVARAVLAHELAHVLWFTRHAPPWPRALIAVLGDALEIPALERRFERPTDLEAIRRGYARGLLALWQWVDRVATPAERARKARIYLSPDEIRRADATWRSGAPDPTLWGEWSRFWRQPLPHAGQ